MRCNLRATFGWVFSVVACCWASLSLATSISVSQPNGYLTVVATDMAVRSRVGAVVWSRSWDGFEWKFNPQWESLSLSWRNLTGSQTADVGGGATSTVASGGGSCWVQADEDWTPNVTTDNGVRQAGAVVAVRTTPFNRRAWESGTTYGTLQRVTVDYATLCPGTSTGGSTMQEAEAIRRGSELYLGENGRYVYDNRTFIEKRAVHYLTPASEAELYASLAGGHLALASQTIPNGFRWQDKTGEWIDYDTQGQVVAWGDKNDNTVWLVRDTQGVLRGVVDGAGNVLFTVHYTGALVTEVKDYVLGQVGQDLAARSVKYRYDTKNRLTEVTDVRGYVTQYQYDDLNHLVKLTDPEGRVEQIAYAGDVVKQRIAPDGGVTDYEFDYDDTNKQFITKISGPETAARRRIEDYTYNRAGQLVRTLVNGRTEQEIQRDTGARVTISTNARGFTTRTTRNEFDLIVKIVHEDGTVSQTSYATQHLQPVEETDEAGIKTQYHYDPRGNLTRKTEAAGTPDERVTEYEVNAYGQPIKITRKGRTEANGTITPDAVWQVEYDALGQIRRTTDPEGKLRQYVYDRVGHLVRFTDSLGHTTAYEVDAEGHPTKVTDALGRVRRFQYDKVGNLVSATDARGKATLTAYDAMNRRTQTTNAVGGTSKFQYDGQGKISLRTDADGRSTQVEFDNYLRLAKQTDALANVTTYGYQVADGSMAGSVGSLYSPTEIQYPTFTLQARYDARERAASRSLIYAAADGSSTQTSTTARSYDKRGLVQSETDAYGKTRSYAYDALRQLTQSTDALDGKTLAQYDVRGNLIALTDAKGNTTRFAFDRNNRLVQETLPLGQITQYQYDDAGNLAQRIDPLGNKNTYRYDDANRFVEMKQYRAGAGGALTLVRTTTYMWDDNDNLTAWRDTDATRPAGQQTASAALTYDDANRKTGETVSYPNPQGSNTSLSYAYQYSLAGKKTQLTWADGMQIGYTYAAHGELESVTIPGEGTISVNQFKWTAPTQTTLPGGSTRTQRYDGLLQLTETHVKTPGQQTTLSLKHSWGKAFDLQLVQRSDTAGGTTRSKDSTYTYDDELRLTQAKTDTGGLFGTDTETFTLDAVANRTAHSRVSGTWAYDANNRLLQRGNAASYQYDEAGNLTQKSEGAKITRYAYDTLNRLVEVVDATGGTRKLIARYGYDPMSRRLWKEQYRDKDGNVLAQAKRTTYLYANEGLIAEATQAITYSATDDTVTASDVPTITTQYGPKPDSEFTTGTLFVKTMANNGQDLTAYYQHNHLQTPIQAIDKAGNVVWAADYNAFGAATITTPTAAADKPTISSNLRLPGQYYDEETGLHYNWYRYYDVAVGHYLSSDPIGLAGGLNTYIYVGGSPIGFFDSDGLQAKGGGRPGAPPIVIPKPNWPHGSIPESKYKEWSETAQDRSEWKPQPEDWDSVCHIATCDICGRKFTIDYDAPGNVVYDSSRLYPPPPSEVPKGCVCIDAGIRVIPGPIKNPSGL